MKCVVCILAPKPLCDRPSVTKKGPRHRVTVTVTIDSGSFEKCVGIKLGWEQGYRLIEMPPRRLDTASGNPMLNTNPKGVNYI